MLLYSNGIELFVPSSPSWTATNKHDLNPQEEMASVGHVLRLLEKQYSVHYASKPQVT